MIPMVVIALCLGGPMRGTIPKVDTFVA